MNAKNLLAFIALVFAVVSMVHPGWVPLGVSVIILCVAVLVTGVVWKNN